MSEPNWDWQRKLDESPNVERMLQAVSAAYQELRDDNWVQWMVADALLTLVSEKLFIAVQHDPGEVRMKDGVIEFDARDWPLAGSVLDSGRGK